jgi:small GTP-binding protein
MKDCPENEDLTEIKLVLIGEQAVGKSSILKRFCDNDFGLNMIGTSGVDFRSKIVKIDNKSVKLIIYDTAGQQRFKSITKNFYRCSNGIILVYDISDKITFDNLKEWIKTVKKNADSSVEIVIVANKTDLEKQVSTEQGKSFALENSIDYIETSAKSGSCIHELFDLIVHNILKKEVSVDKKDESPKLMHETKIKQVNKNNSKRSNQGCCFA